jgi:circadian clock protein KaiC
VQILDVYTSPGQVLTGSARASHEATERDEHASRQQTLERRRRELAQRRSALQAQIEVLLSQIAAEEEGLELSLTEE